MFRFRREFGDREVVAVKLFLVGDIHFASCFYVDIYRFMGCYYTSRGYIITPTPPEKIRVEPSIANIKDLLSDNVDGHDIHFCEDAARIAKPHARDKHRHSVGTHIVSVKIGDHCYHGLCDVGACVSAITQSLHDEIKDEIAPVEMEPIDVTIQLANRDTVCPLGIVRDVKVLCGKMKYPADFLVLATIQDIFCPIIFGRPFLYTINAHIDCEKQTVTVGFDGVSHEFSFSKFGRQPHEKELPSKDEIISLASIVVPPTDPLEQYFLEHENDMHMDERNEIDRVIFEQHPILKNNLLVELLGDPPPPKGDHVFDLKQLPDTLKKGAENPVADNLSMLDNVLDDPQPIDDSFPESMDTELRQVADGFDYKVLKDGGKGSKALRGSFFVGGWWDGYFHSCLASSESIALYSARSAPRERRSTPREAERGWIVPKGVRKPNSLLGLLCRQNYPGFVTLPGQERETYYWCEEGYEEDVAKVIETECRRLLQNFCHEARVQAIRDNYAIQCIRKDKAKCRDSKMEKEHYMKARHNKTEVPQMYDLYAMAHTASYKKVKAFSESGLEHPENFTNISSHHKLVKYTHHGKARKGEDFNPSEGPIDPELVMIACNGRPHGSIAIGDGLIRCPSTLRQIKAHQTSSCPEITPRPWPVEPAIEAAILKEREAMQAVMAEKDKEMRELEERTTPLVEAERAWNDASNRAIYELFVSMCEKTGQVPPAMPVIIMAGMNISRNASHDPSTVEPSPGQPSLGETSQSHRASPP
ncbi:hypothetical protein ZWY2020_032561 [Hordeum vulgare]|nr:hypothetical protein ZWY2020_032561 [Hordeum vulgare]